MDMWYNYVIPPVIGAVIGYGTNAIAIKMLFRPFYPKYIMGKRIPLTPGIIPKEKDRIAASIAEAISENLMNQETMEKNLLSEEMFQKIEQGVDTFCEKQKLNNDTVRQFALNYFSAEDVDGITSNVINGFSAKIGEKISDSDLGAEIAEKAVEYVLQKVNNNPLGMLGGAFVIDKLATPLRDLLSKHITAILKDNAGPIVERMVDNQVQGFMDKPMSQFFVGKDENISKAKKMIVSAYRSLITDHLPHLMAAVDITKIVEERIKEMDVKEMEKLILQVMEKELGYIVWFGALLGGLMGCLNLLLPLLSDLLTK